MVVAIFSSVCVLVVSQLCATPRDDFSVARTREQRGNASVGTFHCLTEADQLSMPLTYYSIHFVNIKVVVRVGYSRLRALLNSQKTVRGPHGFIPPPFHFNGEGAPTDIGKLDERLKNRVTEIHHIASKQQEHTRRMKQIAHRHPSSKARMRPRRHNFSACRKSTRTSS